MRAKINKRTTDEHNNNLLRIQTQKGTICRTSGQDGHRMSEEYVML